jgi:hypothetical protein
MSVVAKLFRGLLAWIDDFLGAAKTVDELFDLLNKVLSICAEFGLKINPNKCNFFLREAEWQGCVVGWHCSFFTSDPRSGRFGAT